MTPRNICLSSLTWIEYRKTNLKIALCVMKHSTFCRDDLISAKVVVNKYVIIVVKPQDDFLSWTKRSIEYATNVTI